MELRTRNAGRRRRNLPSLLPEKILQRDTDAAQNLRQGLTVVISSFELWLKL